MHLCLLMWQRYCVSLWHYTVVRNFKVTLVHQILSHTRQLTHTFKPTMLIIEKIIEICTYSHVPAALLSHKAYLCLYFYSCILTHIHKYILIYVCA